MNCNCTKKVIEYLRPIEEIKTGNIFKPEPNVEYDFWKYRERTMTRPYCKTCGKAVALSFFLEKM